MVTKDAIHQFETFINSFFFPGYDMMIDNDLKVHVLEVNGRPQLQSHVLDKAVNRPMLAEMLKIIGKVLVTKSCRETYTVVRHAL